MNLKSKFMYLRFYLILILFVFLTSCKKKTLPVTHPPSIKIGNVKETKVTTLNDTFIFSFLPSRALDVNGDGEDDIAFWISRTGSPGSGYAWVQGMSLLNDKIAFMGKAFDDSSFQHFDTVYAHPGGSMVWKYMSQKFFFTRQSSTDLVFQNHNPFKIKTMKALDVLNQVDSFANFYCTLIDRNVDHTYSSGQSGDTTFYYTENMNLNKYPYPMNQEIYFGFRFNDGGVSKLGWLKFKILNDVEVIIIETAIQKN